LFKWYLNQERRKGEIMKLYILMYNNEPLETYNDQEDAMAQFECEMEQVGGTEALHIRLVTVEVEKV
jgi:hypothetical protein